MDPQYHFGAQLIIISVFVIMSSICNCVPVEMSSENPGIDVVKNGNPDMIGPGCLPCSQEYLIGSDFDNHPNLSFIDQKLGFDDFCNGPKDSISVFRKLVLHRHLNGEGSHRQLVSTIRFDLQPDDIQWLTDYFCEVVVIERLPIGLFADPFELQHLVRRRVFHNAAVFGDTNLELPSALSNGSIIELHMDIQHCISLRRCVILVELPLHNRYPPLNAGGYVRIDVGVPDIFIGCRQKGLEQDSCYWTVVNVDTKSGNSITWQVPCGNDLHTGTVSSITFGSALVCAFLVVVSTMYFSGKDSKG